MSNTTVTVGPNLIVSNTITGSVSPSSGNSNGSNTIPSAATSNPADLGAVASVGISTKYAREDHIHKMPSAADIGAVSIGNYNPETKTSAMTQIVGKDSNGKLWTAPSSSGTTNYFDLTNKPQIEGITLSGNKTAAELGLAKSSDIPSIPVQSVNNKTGAVVLTASDVGAGTYSKPIGGIPNTDMTDTVQASLNKADSAYQKPSSGIPASDLAPGVILRVPTAYSNVPQPLGTANAGSSFYYSRGDHVHAMPTASDIGAVPVTSYNPVTKTAEMTQPVGKDSNGQLWTIPAKVTNLFSIQTAPDIKNALNMGLNLTDLVGEQITCTKGNDTLTWDVVDYRNDTVTLLLHDIFLQLPFDELQATMWCENGLAAGNYTFKWDMAREYFTLTTPIPAGGQLRANSSAFTTYETVDSTVALESGTVSTTVLDNSTVLGQTGTGLLNHHNRVNSGSNNFAESGLFAWLNSDSIAGTKPERITKLSRPYAFSVAGFLNGLDQNFINCLDNTVWKCNTNNEYECPVSLGGQYTKSTSYTVTAKVGLPSEKEIFGSYDGTDDGSEVYQLFQNATADERKKYYNNSLCSWWLRSPYWSNARYERIVRKPGSAGNYDPYSSVGVAPVVKISKDT